MAYTTIDDPSAYFHTQLYTGNSTNRSITGVGFQPDWTWIKARSETKDHRVFDSTRGATKVLYPSLTNAEGTTSTSLTSFDSDGFSLGTSDGINKNTITYVGWNWKANGGTTASNTDGSITSTVQANTTAGFSIVTFTGTGANATVGHGLGVAPKVVIIKNRSSAAGWMTYHEGVDASNPADYYLFLSGTDARTDDATAFQDTKPTSTVFSIGNGTTQNESSANILAYCFAEIKGYSKFGSYTGNYDADGPFIYTGFKPALVIAKRTDGSGNDWRIADNKRDPFNIVDGRIKPNTSAAEDSSDQFDFLSNGFKVRAAAGDINHNGGTIIYMAFAEHPFVSSKGVPTTAR